MAKVISAMIASSTKMEDNAISEKIVISKQALDDGSFKIVITKNMQYVDTIHSPDPDDARNMFREAQLKYLGEIQEDA